MNCLHIDIETYSSISIKNCGAYRYAESPDFEILLLAYAYNDEPVTVIDLAQGEEIPERFLELYYDKTVKKYAHNAAFERNCFNTVGMTLPPEQWYCTAILSSYCGYPLKLEQVSAALKLEREGKAKLASGKRLIKYFCTPCKPTKKNGGRRRNLPCHDPEKWNEFIEYCRQDVVAERRIHQILKNERITNTERRMYVLDQKINDNGVLIDIPFAKKALRLNSEQTSILHERMIELTGLENPNSPVQLKKWLTDTLGVGTISSIAASELNYLIEEVAPGTGDALEVLELRKMVARTSIKKYLKMLQCASRKDHRARGLFQFYGANKTGRWAGRLIQLQNLPRIYFKNLQLARDTVSQADLQRCVLMYHDIGDLLAQLIRPTLIAPIGYRFVVADFSAIEARVLAWLADETWRLEVFETHGKIYEASAANMFDLDIEDCGKGTPWRAKGKIAELALGFQGGVGALTQMGEQMGDKIIMAMSRVEKQRIVQSWRLANKNIVRFWSTVNRCAMRAVKTRKPVTGPKGIIFNYKGRALTIQLPSKRKLYYPGPSFTTNKFDSECIQYWGIDQYSRKWTRIKTYGGKITENIVQAIARDLLVNSMLKIEKANYKICMHVHDEAVIEAPMETAPDDLDTISTIMRQPVKWAEGLPLDADGYVSPFYKKD